MSEPRWHDADPRPPYGGMPGPDSRLARRALDPGPSRQNPRSYRDDPDPGPQRWDRGRYGEEPDPGPQRRDREWYRDDPVPQPPRRETGRDPYRGNRGPSRGNPGPSRWESEPELYRPAPYRPDSESEPYQPEPYQPGRFPPPREFGQGEPDPYQDEAGLDVRRGRDETVTRPRRDDPDAREPGQRHPAAPPATSWRWGQLAAGPAVWILVAAAAIGAIVTLATRHDPGNLLGAFIAGGTIAAGLAVRPKSVYVFIPLPATAYLVSALAVGLIREQGATTSRTGLTVSATQWVASGFLAMAAATAVAVALTIARWLIARRGGRPESAPRPDAPFPPGVPSRAGSPSRPEPSSRAGSAPRPGSRPRAGSPARPDTSWPEAPPPGRDASWPESSGRPGPAQPEPIARPRFVPGPSSRTAARSEPPPSGPSWSGPSRSGLPRAGPPRSGPGAWPGSPSPAEPADWPEPPVRPGTSSTRTRTAPRPEPPSRQGPPPFGARDLVV